MDEQKLRRLHVLSLLDEAQRYAAAEQWNTVMEKLEYAQQIVRVNLLADEAEMLRNEQQGDWV